MKTEYRAAYYNTHTINELFDANGALAPNSTCASCVKTERSKPFP
jgi:hypothetical protein